MSDLTKNVCTSSRRFFSLKSCNWVSNTTTSIRNQMNFMNVDLNRPTWITSTTLVKCQICDTNDDDWLMFSNYLTRDTNCLRCKKFRNQMRLRYVNRNMDDFKNTGHIYYFNIRDQMEINNNINNI